MLHAEVDQASLSRDTDTVEDVELGLLERRGHLVLDDLHPRAVSDGVGAVLQRLDATDVQAHGGVELQRLSARGGLGRAEEDADLLTQLVDEDRGGLGGVEPTGQFAQRLRHQARLQTHVGITHLSFDLGLRHESRDGVDDDQVDGTGTDQHVGDLERLLSCVGLRHEERIDVDAELLRVVGVEGVLRVDERGDPAGALAVRDGVQGQRRLTRRLRSVDLDDAPARKPADAERHVERDRSGRDDLDRGAFVAAQAHDRPLAELAVDLGESRFEGLLAVSG